MSPAKGVHVEHGDDEGPGHAQGGDPHPEGDAVDAVDVNAHEAGRLPVLAHHADGPSHVGSPKKNRQHRRGQQADDKGVEKRAADHHLADFKDLVAVGCVQATGNWPRKS